MENPKTREWLAWAITVLLIVVSTVFGIKFPAIPAPPMESLGYTHFSGLVVTEPTTVATATPGAVINSLGLGSILEIQDASTPLVSVYNGGGIKNAAPTAIATGQPAAVFDSLGVSNILEVRDAATPVVKVSAAGNTQLSRVLNYECTYVEAAADANSQLLPVSTCYIAAVATSKNLDYTLQVTNVVTGTLLIIHEIGAGTLVITDTNLLSHDGNALSLSANDVAELMFTGTKWMQLIELAGS